MGLAFETETRVYMKKILSILLLTAILLSLVVVATSAETVTFDNVKSNFSSVPSNYEFLTEDAGNYVRAKYIKSNIDQNMKATHSATTDERYVVIDTKWRLPAIDKSSDYFVELQLHQIKNGSAAQSWVNLFRIFIKDGTLRVQLKEKIDTYSELSTACKLNFDAWNDVRVVIDRENATRKVYVNGILATYSSSTTSTMSDFTLQKAESGFTVDANKLICLKLNKLSLANVNLQDNASETASDSTPYVDFKFVRMESSDDPSSYNISAGAPVYSLGRDDTVGDYIHVPYVSANYDKGTLASHDAVTADSGRFIVIDSEWYIPENNTYWRTQMQFKTMTSATGTDQAWSNFFEIRTCDGEVYLTDYATGTSKSTTLQGLFNIGEWNNIRVVIDRVNCSRKVIINNTLCKKSDGTSDFMLEKGIAVGANFTVKANQLVVAKIMKYNISSANKLETTESSTTPYINFRLNSFETVNYTEVVGYQVTDTNTETGTYDARLVAKFNLLYGNTLADFNSVGFKVTATYGTDGEKNFKGTTTNVYSSVAGYTNGETTVSAYTAEALGGDYLFVLPILNIPTSIGTVTITVTTFCTTSAGEILGNEQTFTIADNTALS